MLEFGLKRQEKQEGIDFWDELTEAQKNRINQSVKEIASGQGLSHEEVMARFRKKYKA